MPRARISLKLVISWILQILLALLFAVRGFIKIMGSPNWVTRFRQWGYPQYFYLIVGIAELVGAVLLLIPGLARFGALLLTAVMVGAAGTHLLHHEPQVLTTLVLLALLGTVLFLRFRVSPERLPAK